MAFSIDSFESYTTTRRTATPMAAIRGTGQIGLNRAAVELLKEGKRTFLVFDATKPVESGRKRR